VRFFFALLHRAERVGAIDGTRFTTDGLDTIDATAVDTSVLGLGHGHCADQRSLLTDLGIVVGPGLPAAQRGLAQAERQRYRHFPRRRGCRPGVQRSRREAAPSSPR
jgi:hypothetical protein